MNTILKYTCPKCGNKLYEANEIWAVGSLWTRIFEYHNRRFTFVACSRCHYTELYKIPLKNIAEAFDFQSK